jgi:hypothetical protein
MKHTPEQLALQQILAVCQTHAATLAEALQDLQLRALTLDDYDQLRKEDRRLLDQFAYRYTRLQAAKHAAQQLLAMMVQFTGKLSV